MVIEYYVFLQSDKSQCGQRVLKVISIISGTHSRRLNREARANTRNICKCDLMPP